jgi:hypothetical protein
MASIESLSGLHVEGDHELIGGANEDGVISPVYGIVPEDEVSLLGDALDVTDRRSLHIIKLRRPLDEDKTFQTRPDLGQDSYLNNNNGGRHSSSERGAWLIREQYGS